MAGGQKILGSSFSEFLKGQGAKDVRFQGGTWVSQGGRGEVSILGRNLSFFNVSYRFWRLPPGPPCFINVPGSAFVHRSRERAGELASLPGFRRACHNPSSG